MSLFLGNIKTLISRRLGIFYRFWQSSHHAAKRCSGVSKQLRADEPNILAVRDGGKRRIARRETRHSLGFGVLTQENLKITLDLREMASSGAHPRSAGGGMPCREGKNSVVLAFRARSARKIFYTFSLRNPRKSHFRVLLRTAKFANFRRCTKRHL